MDIAGACRKPFQLSKLEPRSAALGAALGVFLGLAPLDSGLAALAALLVCLSDASVVIAALAGISLKLVATFALDGPALEIGRSVNESAVARGLGSLYGWPVVALLGLERYHVMGALL